MSSELCNRSAADLIDLYRTRRASPVEVTSAILQRIETLNPVLNAFCFVAPDALEQARRSEARWMRGEPARGARRRAGVDQGPAAHRRLADAARLEDGRSRRALERRRAGRGATARARRGAARQDHDAGVRLERASPTARSPASRAIRGTPRRRRAARPAAAPRRVAAGMGPLTVGTDGGGSIRIPCAFTGLFGLKPSFGRVPAWPLSPVRHRGARRADDAHGRRRRADAERARAARRARLARAAARRPRLPRRARGRRARLAHRAIRRDPRLRERGSGSRRDGRAARRCRFAELGAHVEDVALDCAGVDETFRRHWFSGAAFLLRNFTVEQKALMDPGSGRGGRAGRSGSACSICSTRRRSAARSAAG